MYRSINKWQLGVVGWIFMLMPGLILAEKVVINMDSKTGRDLFSPVTNKKAVEPKSTPATSSSDITWPLKSPSIDQNSSNTPEDLLNLEIPANPVHLVENDRSSASWLREYLSLLVSVGIIVLIVFWWWFQKKVLMMKGKKKASARSTVLDLKNQAYVRKIKRS